MLSALFGNVRTKPNTTERQFKQSVCTQMPGTYRFLVYWSHRLRGNRIVPLGLLCSRRIAICHMYS